MMISDVLTAIKLRLAREHAMGGNAPLDPKPKECPATKDDAEKPGPAPPNERPTGPVE
jgi:hypothetical protein